VGELHKNGLKVGVREQLFQVLTILLEHPGEMVTREELREQIWSKDTFVDFERSLNVAVSKLREALGDSAESPRFIETLPRRGYRFIYPVQSIDGEPEPPPGHGRDRPDRSRWLAVAAVVLATTAIAAGPVPQWLRQWLFPPPEMRIYLPANRQWGLDASLFKTIPINERFRIRFNADFFNVLNNPGNDPGLLSTRAASSGILETRKSGQAARELQLTLRLIW
jgi:DNA-binding winged helix-turn-helix (wHTH) protein